MEESNLLIKIEFVARCNPKAVVTFLTEYKGIDYPFTERGFIDYKIAEKHLKLKKKDFFLISAEIYKKSEPVKLLNKYDFTTYYKNNKKTRFN